MIPVLLLVHLSTTPVMKSASIDAMTLPKCDDEVADQVFGQFNTVVSDADDEAYESGELKNAGSSSGTEGVL